MVDIKDETINWSRCIYVNGEMNNDLLRDLLPKILELRGNSSDPISIAIDSPGGSVAMVETLLKLLEGPDQDSSICSTITVSVNHAYSAAAILLAKGNYAVALPHSDVLFHDVRYGGLEDVTSTKAKNAASKLKSANDRSALDLAHHLFRRLVWNYIDLLSKSFLESSTKFSLVYERYTRCIEECLGRAPIPQDIKVAEFLTCMFAMLSKQNEKLVADAVSDLMHWRQLTQIAEAFDTRGADSVGLLEGSYELFVQMRQALQLNDADDIWKEKSSDLKIIYTLFIEGLAKNPMGDKQPIGQLFDEVTDSFALIKAIDDPAHQRSIARLLLRHKHAFFSPSDLAILAGDDKDAEKKVLEAVKPSVEILWIFCVLLCRRLFTGEHILSAKDAQVLGVVDEVAGGSQIESKREFCVKANATEAKAAV